MTDREAMKMALDALENPHSGWIQREKNARKALHQALAQPEQKQECDTCAAKRKRLIDAGLLKSPLRNELAKPEQLFKYSDIVSNGGLDPRNKFDAQPEFVVPFPSFMRKRIEQAMEDAIHPKGMSVHDGKATVLVSDLHRMLLMIDSTSQHKEEKNDAV